MEHALTLDPEYVPAWLYKGSWLNALGRYADARQALERARDLGAAENASAGIARALVGEGQFEEAVAMLEPLVAETGHPQVHRLLGRAYQALGRTDDAKIATARGKDTTPMTWSDPLQRQKWQYEASLGRRLMHAERLLQAGRYDEAVDVLEPLRMRGLGEEALFVNLSLAYGRSGQTEKALAVVQEGIAAAPENYRFQNVLAGIYQNIEQPDRAMTHLRRSIELHPVQVWPYERLAGLLMEQGRYAEALEAVDTAVDFGAEDAQQLHYTAGMLEGVRERWPEAVARFEQATALDAAFTMAYIYLGRCLAEMGRFEDAREALAWAQRLDTHPAELASARRRLAALEAEA
jgi:tetratricopeptide (TPR) repeat protein